jgi:2-desacetyl-2-hydroxyethyl bacteriochlorophyllide A dehydrogenase
MIETPMIRKAVVTAVDTIELIEVPAPRPGVGEVSVRTSVAGICGSDLHAVAGHHPWMRIPFPPGHEVVGIVDTLGPGVTSVAVGARVTVEPTLPCWHCKQCLAGNENICENLRFLGCGYAQGAIADSFTVPANRLHVLDESMSDLDAVLIEPLATPCHAVRLAVGDGSLAGRTVAIVGGGTIGQLTLAAVLDRGADSVVVIDPMASKRELARRRGAAAAFDPAVEDLVETVLKHFGETVDVVFDCVAIEATVEQGVRLVGRAGTVVIVGVPARDVVVPLQVVQDRQIRIQGAATYVPEDYATAMRIIASGAVAAEDFISAEFPLDQASEALEAAKDLETVKVVVCP